MIRTKLTRLFQIVLLSGMLLSHIEIASAQSNEAVRLSSLKDEPSL